MHHKGRVILVGISPFRSRLVDFRDLCGEGWKSAEITHFAVAEVIGAIASCRIHETYKDYD
jgi:hypothetical protein